LTVIFAQIPSRLEVEEVGEVKEWRGAGKEVRFELAQRFFDGPLGEEAPNVRNAIQ